MTEFSVSSLNVFFRRREIFEDVVLGRQRIAEPHCAVLPVINNHAERDVAHSETAEDLAVLVEQEAYVVAQTLTNAGVDHFGRFAGDEDNLQRAVALIDASPQAETALQAVGRTGVDKANVDKARRVGRSRPDIIIPPEFVEVDARSTLTIGYALRIRGRSGKRQQQY